MGKGKITYTLQVISIVPLFFMGIAILLVSYGSFSQNMNAEVELELSNAAKNLATMMDLAYPGDYTLKGDDVFRLYKGDSDITRAYYILDTLKKNTGLDATVFYKDTRILTTIVDQNGSRIVGTGAPRQVIEQVLNTGESRFYLNTRINKDEFFSYYMPLTNEDGTIAGMIFVGRPSKSVDQAIQSTIMPLLVIVLLVMLVIGLCLFIYMKRFASVFIKLDLFLAETASGNFDIQLDQSVLSRNDELGEIANSAVKMQRSLCRMIEQDPLTTLYNRRSANRRLNQLLSNSAKTNAPFSICIADIDFFKGVNDTYGHEAGDAVLKQTALLLKEYIKPLGFAARWGGEEFLLVFENMNKFDTANSLKELLDKVRGLEVKYDDKIIKITMTFGVTDNVTSDIDHMIRLADDNLYRGKESGRNQVVF